MRFPMPSLPFALVASTLAGIAFADDAGLRRCRALAEPAARLACYDGLPLSEAPAPRAPSPRGASPAPALTPPTAAASTPPSPEARFGLERQATVAEIPAIESHIPGLFEGWRPNSRIRLANGQVWQIADDSSRMLERRDPKVTIRRAALGAFFLDLEGDNRSPRVRRVQ